MAGRKENSSRPWSQRPGLFCYQHPGQVPIPPPAFQLSLLKKGPTVLTAQGNGDIKMPSLDEYPYPYFLGRGGSGMRQMQGSEYSVPQEGPVQVQTGWPSPPCLGRLASPALLFHQHGCSKDFSRKLWGRQPSWGWLFERRLGSTQAEQTLACATSYALQRFLNEAPGAPGSLASSDLPQDHEDRLVSNWEAS